MDAGAVFRIDGAADGKRERLTDLVGMAEGDGFTVCKTCDQRVLKLAFDHQTGQQRLISRAAGSDVIAGV